MTTTTARSQAESSDLLSDLPEDDDTVIYLTDEDIRRGDELALKEIGMTYKELEACAQADEFPTHKARLTWFLLAPRVENC